MNKQDWLISSMITVLVAVMTIALMNPSIGWAGQETLVAVPELPSTQLKMPSINAEVSASTVPEPGQGVKVTLDVKSTEGGKVAEVPVTITVLRTDINPMARSLPLPKQVTQVVSAVPVDSGGNGSVVVELPLIWAEKATIAVTANNNLEQKPISQVETRYQMVLSSSLGGEAAPILLRLAPPAVLKNNSKVVPNTADSLLIDQLTIWWKDSRRG